MNRTDPEELIRNGQNSGLESGPGGYELTATVTDAAGVTANARRVRLAPELSGAWGSGVASGAGPGRHGGQTVAVNAECAP